MGRVRPLVNPCVTLMEYSYLDYNASAPLRDDARSAMLDALAVPGNASSVHTPGRNARRIVEDARRDVAALVNARPEQVIFTSGATEANNTVLRGFVAEEALLSAIEHPSVLEVLPGAAHLPVTQDGVVDVDAAIAMMDGMENCALVSVMLVNNETGVIQPVAEIAEAAKQRGILVHCDAVQAAGRIGIDMNALQVDYLSLSAHKFGGPKGAGALVTAPLAQLEPLIFGGGQELRRRAGTENVAAIAGFGMAARGVAAELDDYAQIAQKRDALEKALKEISPQIRIMGENAARVANTTQAVLPGAAAETMLMALDLAGVAVSSGSACSSGKVHASHVLTAMGLGEADASAAVRISMGAATTKGDIERFISAWESMYNRLKDKLDQAS